MCPYREKEIEKVCWRISEVAEKFGLPITRIRCWDNYFKVSHKRGSRKERIYTNEDIEKIAYIRKLILIDMYTLAGAKKVYNGKYLGNNS